MVPFRDCTGEEEMKESRVLDLLLMQAWSLGQSGGRSLLG